MKKMIKIEKLVFGGKGLGFINNKPFDKAYGRPFFVYKAVPGDELEIEIIKDRKDFAEAKINKIIKPSAQRIKPPCPYFEQCGGCEHQNISYSDQLKFKEEIFIELINKSYRSSEARTNKYDSSRPQTASNNIKILPIIAGSNHPFYYRNSIRFFFMHKKNGDIAFGRSRFDDASKLVEIDSCLLQSETTNKIISHLKEYINQNINDKQFLWQLKIRQGKQTAEFMVEIITTSEELPQKEGIVGVLKKIDGIKSIYHTVAPAKSLNNLERHLIYGSPIIQEKIGKYTFQISPQSFFQTNSLGVKTLYDKIKEFADTQMGDNVLDLYCGTGTIGIYLSAMAKKITGVESVAEAVRDAIDNAKINKVSNINFFYQDSLDYLSALQPTSYNLQAIIVDPPRAGLNKKVIDKLARIKFKKLVYVSCNPTTFIRDINLFENKGLKLVNIQPLDMFPHTHHLELVSLLHNLN